MKKKYFPLLVSIFFLQLTTFNVAFAEQLIRQGDYQIHYSVFPSNVINPKVAATYEIKRSGYRALVNITPQKILNENQTIGVKAKVSGSAKNLIGNTKTLEFREVIEGDVIYYLAEFNFSNEETFRFKIDISPDNENGLIIPINFKQKFYTE